MLLWSLMAFYSNFCVIWFVGISWSIQNVSSLILQSTSVKDTPYLYSPPRRYQDATSQRSIIQMSAISSIQSSSTNSKMSDFRATQMNTASPCDLILSSGFCAFARQAGFISAVNDFGIKVIEIIYVFPPYLLPPFSNNIQYLFISRIRLFVFSCYCNRYMFSQLNKFNNCWLFSTTSSLFTIDLLDWSSCRHFFWRISSFHVC